MKEVSRAARKKRESLKSLRRNFRRGEKIERLTYYTGIKRGERSESIVEDALRRLCLEGKIEDYFRSERGSPEDRRGIDFKIKKLSGEIVFLQVKSSFFGAERFAKRGREEIVLIVIDTSDDTESVKGKLEKILQEQEQEQEQEGF